MSVNLLLLFYNSGDFGNGSMAGGFFNAGTPGGTVNTPGEKKVCKLKRHISISCTFFSCVLLFQGSGAQRAHNIIPVNIKDILDAEDEKLKIEDTEAHMVFPISFTYMVYMMLNVSFLLGHICWYCRTNWFETD